MSKRIIKSGDIEVGKREFHSFKDPILFSESDIDKLKISKRVSSGENIYKYLVTNMMIMKLKSQEFMGLEKF